MGKGHAAVGGYPMLADWGFIDPECWTSTRGSAARSAIIPTCASCRAIDFSSGSIGHSLSVGLGMALGGRLQGRDFNVFVLLGDGEMQEGQVWEAALSAADQRAGQLDRHRRPQRLLARRARSTT